MTEDPSSILGGSTRHPPVLTDRGFVVQAIIPSHQRCSEPASTVFMSEAGLG